MPARKQWRPQLTQSERRQGWVFFAMYLLVFPFLLPLLLQALDDRFALYFSVATSNAAYYFIIAVTLVVVFWAFLRHGFSLLLDWLPENLFALAIGFLSAALLTLLTQMIPLPVTNPILADYAQQYTLSPGATIAIVVILRPLAEEILFRGLLFGGLRTVNRTLGYCVTVPLFALCAVWQYVFPGGDWRYLLLAVQYLPISLALTWCYDNGGSIWSPIFLHMLYSGAVLTILK